jgi:hypothetical protein
MHRLHGLPFAVVEQRVEVLTGRRTLRLPTEAVGEAIGKLSEPTRALEPTAPSRAEEYKTLDISTSTKKWIGPYDVLDLTK